MLRILALVLAIGLPGLALAEQFPQSARDVDVRADGGNVVGRVAAVERNADGDIVAAEIPGLEPADAPRASRDLIAEDQRAMMLRIRASASQRARNEIQERRLLR